MIDFHHAYAFFQRGHNSPDEYFPKSNRLLPLLKEYREQRGPFRFGQIVRGKIGRKSQHFETFLISMTSWKSPRATRAFIWIRFQSSKRSPMRKPRLPSRISRSPWKETNRAKDWLGTRTNSFPRAKFFSRILHFDSQDALRRALEGDEFDWRNEAAVCGAPVWLRKTQASQPAGTNDVVQFESFSPGVIPSRTT